MLCDFILVHSSEERVMAFGIQNGKQLSIFLTRVRIVWNSNRRVPVVRDSSQFRFTIRVTLM